jgi:hypothetical protein
MATVTCRLTVPYRTLGLNADVVGAIGERALDAPCDIALVTFDGGVAAPLDRIRWLPSAGECEIITVPNRDDRHIQRGGQL